jgi:hypothetical protein
VNIRNARVDWPAWRKLVVIAVLMAPVMLWVLFSNGQLFTLVLAYGIGISGLGSFWLGGWKWLLVPVLAMGVELIFAIPATMLDPSSGETPISVILETPSWTGAPAFVGAMIGAVVRWFADFDARTAGQGHA